RETVGRPGRRARDAAGRSLAAGFGPRPRGGDPRRAPRAAARADLLAGGRGTVPDAPPRLHAAPGTARPQPRDLSHASPRSPDDRHALADRQGRRLPLRRGRGPGREPAGDRFPGRTSGAAPRRGGTAAGERPRADARLADRRRAPRPVPGTWTTSARRLGRDRPDRPCAAPRPAPRRP